MARPLDPELRQRLIEAAAREFAARGFHGASMSELGRAAGVTKGGVYFHFASKEELFFAVVDSWREAERALLAPRPAGSEAAPLESFLVAYLGFHFRRPEFGGLMRVLATEMRGRFTAQVREDREASLRAVPARIRDLLMQGSRDGSLFTTDPALATFVLAAAVEGLISLVSAAPRGTEPLTDPESIVEFLLAPYRTGRARGTRGSDSPGEPDGVDFLPPV